MRTQREFLKAAATQILSGNNIFKIDDIMQVVFENIETNLKMEDIIKYIPSATEFNPENIQSEMLPGVADYIGVLSFYVNDEEETNALVSSLFGLTEEQIEANKEKFEKKVERKYVLRQIQKTIAQVVRILLKKILIRRVQPQILIKIVRILILQVETLIQVRLLQILLITMEKQEIVEVNQIQEMAQVLIVVQKMGQNQALVMGQNQVQVVEMKVAQVLMVKQEVVLKQSQEMEKLQLNKISKENNLCSLFLYKNYLVKSITLVKISPYFSIAVSPLFTKKLSMEISDISCFSTVLLIFL